MKRAAYHIAGRFWEAMAERALIWRRRWSKRAERFFHRRDGA